MHVQPAASLVGQKRKPEEMSHPPRKITAFGSNITLSRSASGSCDIYSPQAFSKFSELRDRIADHCYRRIFLFYYLNVVYFKEGCTITIARTDQQHGQASCGLCHAAHSCLLPHLQDDFALKLIQLIETKGITKKAAKKANLLHCVSLSKRKLIKELQEKESLIDPNSFIKKLQNSCVEVPKEVNYYDMLIEGVLRPKALRLLNQASLEKITPYESAVQFCQMLNAFFDKSEAQIIQKELEIGILENQEAEFYEEEKKTRKKSRLLPSDIDSFLKKLILLKRKHQVINKLNHYSPYIELSTRLENYRTILNEIFSIYYQDKDEIKLMNLADLKTRSLNLLKNKNNLKLPFFLLEKIVESSNINHAKNSYFKFMFESDLIDYFHLTGQAKKIHAAALTFFSNIPLKEFPPTGDIRRKLHVALKILKIQRESSKVPHWSILSRCLYTKELKPHESRFLKAEKLTLTQY